MSDTSYEETLNAIDESIKHWEDNKRYTVNRSIAFVNTTGDACALCELFYDNGNIDQTCAGCPVYELRDQQTDCGGIRWHNAYVLHRKAIKCEDDVKYSMTFSRQALEGYYIQFEQACDHMIEDLKTIRAEYVKENNDDNDA